jgi:hypothetical protein
MNKSCIAIAVLSVLLVKSANAQVDSSRHSISAKAVKVGSSDVKQSPSKEVLFKKEDRVELQIDQIPDALRLTLEQGKDYRGWHNAVIFLDRSTKEYTFHITDSTATTRTFKFDENGNLLPLETARPSKKKSNKDTSKKSGE